MRLLTLTLMLVASLLAHGAKPAEEMQRLRHNPFAVPPEFARPGQGNVGPVTIAPTDLALHAIIPGPPDRAMVSLNGIILRIGEVHSGYELVAVMPNSARFRREDGSEFQLELRALEGKPASLPENLQTPAEEPAAESPPEEPSDEEQTAP